MNGFGGGVFGPGTTPTLNSPANVKSVELMMKWAEKDGILPAEPSSALITSLFNDGKAAMVFSGPWFLGEIAKGVDFGLAPLPTLDEAGGKPMRPWMTVEGVYVSAPSQNKDAAFEVAKFLTDAAAAKVLALEGRQSPANQTVYSDAKISGDAQLKAFRDQVEVAVPMPNVPEMTMVWSPATSAMNGILKKASTPKAALDVAQKAVAKDVAGLRKK
jgi:arabinogalactan oligomer/maltooligosaccharide transport system substrate-binding protein